MAVTVIVENGTIVAGANSFMDVATFRMYATNRGLVLPTDDDAVATMLIKAADAVNRLEPKFDGTRVSFDQTMSWPRHDCPVPGQPRYVFADDEIPALIIQGQAEYAMAVAQGADLAPVTTSRQVVKRRKVGPIETEFMDGGYISEAWQIAPAGYDLLSQLFKSAGAFRTVRV